MARPKKPATMEIVSLRLSKGMIEEIDSYTQRLQAETPLLQITKADAIRYLIARGLQASSGKGRKEK